MKRLALLLLVIVVAVVLAFMSLPEDPGQVTKPDTAKTAQKSEAEAKETAEKAAVEAERDKRLEAMKAEYAKLEKARRNLRQRLQAVSYYLGQAETLPKDRAQSMRDEIGTAHRILINPPLLGAFSGVDDIKQELAKIERINQQLDEFEAVIREHGGYEDAQN